MLTKLQLKERLKGIGGSDMPIIMGLSSYSTPYQLFLQKTGILSSDSEPTPSQIWGHKLEPVIREEFSRNNNVKIETPGVITHPDHSFLRGNVDGLIPEWNSVLEIKTSNAFMAQYWGENGSTIVPYSYLVQVAHYCAITLSKSAHIAVLLGGSDYRELIYHRDLEMEKILFEKAFDFWEHVKKNIPPNPTKIIDLKILFPKHDPDKTIKSNDIVSEELQELYDLKKKAKDIKERELESKFKIMQYMKDSECLTDSEGTPLVTWKSNVKGNRVFLVKG